MKTVPLRGRKAAGRVVLVDDEDYELVSQYRWHVLEPPRKPGRRQDGPYAETYIDEGGQRRRLRMHNLIMGFKGIDHIDHDGLNNQRSNLRRATTAQNSRNVRPRLTCRSQYKGITLGERGMWRAYITMDGLRRQLGDFVSELEAAYAYDAAARELHGEFACPNFRDEPTQAMREQWQAEREERKARLAVERADRNHTAGFWAERKPETFACQWCNAEFQSRAVGKKLYCGQKCRDEATNHRRLVERREKRRQREAGLLF